MTNFATAHAAASPALQIPLGSNNTRLPLELTQAPEPYVGRAPEPQHVATASPPVGLPSDHSQEVTS